MKIVPFAGFDRCALFQCGYLELIVTLEVGPRILFFGPSQGQNMLAVYEKDYGIKDDGKYHSYGGHRLWIAPEEKPKTFFADSTAVTYVQEGDQHVFTSPLDPYHIVKEIRVRTIEGEVPSFEIEHRVYNHGVYPTELAPWGITVMAPGGECIFPQADLVPHSEQLLPIRPLVLWSYTQMQDPRWTWGNRVVRLKQTPDGGSQKAGAFVSQGIATYTNFGMTFVKRFAAIEAANYPDFGCNFEVYTRQDMLEVESLGPLTNVAPNCFVSHTEKWFLELDSVPPAEDGECGDWMRNLLTKCN